MNYLMSARLSGQLRLERSWVSATLTCCCPPLPGRKYSRHPNISPVSATAAGPQYFPHLLLYNDLNVTIGPPPSQPSRPGRTFTARRSWLMVTTSSSRPSRQCCSMSSPAGPAVTTGSHWPDSDRLFCRHLYTSRPATDRGRITL